MKEIVTQKVEKVKKYSIFPDTSQQEQPESFLDKCRKRYYALLRQKLNEFYIEKSKETDDKIADIAMAVGYATQPKFGAAFKACYGVTPLEYRRQNRLIELKEGRESWHPSGEEY